MAIPARISHEQQTLYIGARLNYNSTGAAAGIAIGTLPAGARITQIRAYVKTAFNAGTTNPVAVGITGTGATVAASASVAADVVGAKDITTGLNLEFATDTTIYVSYIPTGTAATAGALDIVIAYVGPLPTLG